jgi:ADP-heptose:LPS heptosyltransferase
LSIAGAHFFSLQKDVSPESAARIDAGMSWVDASAEFSDFARMAGLIQELDLIISVDTAIAHLAGALGKPVWTLLPAVPDWRWGLQGSRSAWYPTMQLFRQKVPGDWPGVITEVQESLRNAAEKSCTGKP